jgi:DNA mismatch repair protein MutS
MSETVPHWLVTAEVDDGKLTAVMRQCVTAKRQHPDALVFFRLGDFYELFFEDALEGAQLLDLALTSRNKQDPRPIPMCGFPVHQMPAYVQKVLEAGRRCAVVEQLEDPATAKGIVQRGVTHVITPGVVLEAEALDAKLANRVVALAPGKAGVLGVAVADVSTGECLAGEVPHPPALAVLLVRLEAREIVLPEAALPWLDGAAVARNLPRTVRALAGRAEVAQEAALALLHAYLAEVRPGASGLLLAPAPLTTVAHLDLGRETVLHLELMATARLGRRQGALLHAVDRTQTGAGARLLRALLLAPLADRQALELRHAAVQVLVTDRPTRATLRQRLARQGDLARIATRAVAGLATPRDLHVLRETLATLPDVQAALAPCEAVALAAIGHDLTGVDDLRADLDATLCDPPRAQPTDGGVIRPGIDPQLDELCELAERSHDWLARFEADERAATGLGTLRVTYNRVSGYGIEIGRSRADQVPAHYHRKQTLKNVERYTTPALIDFERKLASATDERVALESRLFRQLVARVGERAGELRRIGHALAELDVHAGFAELAAEQGYVRPRFTDAPVLRLRGCRHPVVEQLVAHGSFVPNDVLLAEQPGEHEAQLWLLTGPNMAGKSTLMRQVALAVILAQAGSFVPADDAELSPQRAVLTRIGAGDDISEGASTFLIEMRETAELLARAGPGTLVLLDEVGRGTSTGDGLAIAWAVAEALHERKALGLFATHYHELTKLDERLPRLRNAHVAVREWGQDIVFVHRLQPGPTSRSHGIAVARLAGLPAAVVARARELLDRFEMPPMPRRQIGLFEPPPEADPKAAALLARLLAVDPDELSPRQAHALLAEWVAAARA